MSDLPPLPEATPAPTPAPDRPVSPAMVVTEATEAPEAAGAASAPEASAQEPSRAPEGQAEQPAEVADQGPAEAPAAADAAPPQPAAPTAPAKPEQSPAQCAELLKQHFPALFGGPFKPLKLRIQADIQQRTPGVFTKRALGAFFHRYTGATGYLIALTKHTERFDLDGQPAGELSEEHRHLAQEELQRRRQVTRERERQSRQGAGRPADARTSGQDAAAMAQAGAEGVVPGAPVDSAEGGERPARDGGQRPPRPPRPPHNASGERAAPAGPRQPHDRRPAAPGRDGPRRDRPPQGDRTAQGQRPRGAGGERPPDSARHDRPPRADRPERNGQRTPGAPISGQRRPDDRSPRPPRGEGGAELPPPMALSPEEQQAHEARRQRANLLRDFERSPFSLASFCALKGMKPEELQPQLEQARRESAERQRPPRG